MRITPLAAVAAVVAVIAAAAPAAQAHKPKRVTLTYTTKLTSLTRVPVAGQASATPVPGDYVVITDEYRNARGRVVGTDVVHCTLITTEKSLCNMAVQLPKGQLELQGIGPAGGAGDFTVAIIGGTGAYAGARGEASFKSGPDDTGTETFRILL